MRTRVIEIVSRGSLETEGLILERFVVDILMIEGFKVVVESYGRDGGGLKAKPVSSRWSCCMSSGQHLRSHHLCAIWAGL